MEHLTAESESDSRNTSTDTTPESNQGSQEFNHSNVKFPEQYPPLNVSAAELPPLPRQFQPVMDSVHCENKGPHSFRTTTEYNEKLMLWGRRLPLRIKFVQNQFQRRIRG